MEFPMRIVVATVVLLIAILIFLFMVAGWFGKSDEVTNSFFDWLLDTTGITEGGQPVPGTAQPPEPGQ